MDKITLQDFHPDAIKDFEGYCEEVFGMGVLDDDYPDAFNELAQLLMENYPDVFEDEVPDSMLDEIYWSWFNYRL